MVRKYTQYIEYYYSTSKLFLLIIQSNISQYIQ